MAGAPDYESLIDAETWAFIRETESHYPPDAVEMSVAEQRRLYNDMCRAFYQGHPAGIEVTDRSADGVPVRVYVAGKPTATVVYFHGGGFVVGGLDSHDDVCAEILQNTGYRVVSVDYRLAPEHAHPAAFEDARTATLWAAREFAAPLVLAGDSAGGNLAAAVAHTTRGEAIHVRGQVLIYPGLGGDMDRGSCITHAKAPLLSRDEILFYKDIRLAGPEPRNDPSYAPLQDTDFTHLPPTIVFSAECDPICDDGRDYCARITQAGGKASWICEPGLVHGYLRARTTVERARASFEKITLGIEALGQNIWPDL